MATYVIGDVQGCFKALTALLTHIQFNPHLDTLWFAGDIINRGPDSLATIRFIKSLGEKHITVLGNHDLSFLAIAYGTRDAKKGDTIEDILQAPDREELIEWLRNRPLLHADRKNNLVLTHAGLAPSWSLDQAIALAHEVETVLASDQIKTFLSNMYGDDPAGWQDDLEGQARLRCIVNYFTRLRYCHADGSMDFDYKGAIKDMPDGLIPWYRVPNRVNAEVKIVFGHWAAINGVTDTKNVIAVDTGCIWGNCLTAWRIEDDLRFSVGCG